MGFQKAKKEKVWTKTLISGPSGAGKSRSALEMATGLARMCNSRIAYIGTEGSRDKYYAANSDAVEVKNGQKLFPYDLLQIDAPQTPEKYIEAIDEAVAGGYQVLIIDSISHEWKTINDIHDKMPGNSFTNWGKLKPRHKNFEDKIMLSPIHIIATGRGKDDWVLEDKNGKQVPKKVGLGVQQDKDTTYQYTVSLMVEQDTHIAHADKDNTGIFEGRYEMITEKDGEALYRWANDSDIPATVKEATPEEPIVDTDTLDTIKKQIVAKCKELGGTKNETVKAAVDQLGNPNKLTTVEDAQKYLEFLNN